MDNFGITPFAFDHAIVKVETKNKTYWLDPTQSIIKGRTADLTPPRYEKALVLRKGESALTNIPLRERDEKFPHSLVTDFFDLTNGLHKEAKWTRKTKYNYENADYMRKQVMNAGLKQIGVYLYDSRKALFEGITQNKPFAIEDHDNSLTLIENYIVPEPAKYDQQYNKTNFEYRPRNISDALRRPAKIKGRKAPYQLAFPLRVEAILNIELPDRLFKPFENNLKSPYHTFKQKGEYSNGKFQIKYEYKTLQDHVSVEDLKKFSEEIDLIYSQIYFRISAIGKEETDKLYVYQPGLKKYRPTQHDYDEVIDTIDALFDDVSPTGKVDEEKITQLLNMKAAAGSFKKRLFRVLSSYYMKIQLYDEALHYIEMFQEKNTHFRYRTYTQKSKIFEGLEKLPEAIYQMKEVLRIVHPSLKSKKAKSWHSRLRRLYWMDKDFKNLKTELEYLTENFPDNEKYFRELGVVYTLLNDHKNTLKLNDKMKKLGYEDLEIVKVDKDSEYPRKLRSILKIAPIYPYAAMSKNIEGHVIVEFTVKISGRTEGCKIIKAVPKKYFEKAACKAISYFYYYPAGKGEAKVDVHNVKHKVTFQMEG